CRKPTTIAQIREYRDGGERSWSDESFDIPNLCRSDSRLSCFGDVAARARLVAVLAYVSGRLKYTDFQVLYIRLSFEWRQRNLPGFHQPRQPIGGELIVFAELW